MRILVAACIALTSCFGPTVGDGSFLCEAGLECPEGMFCRTDCSPRRCYFDPNAACPADAGVFDAPLPVADSRFLDAPPGNRDAPLPPDAPRPIDGPPSTIDGPPIIRIDSRIFIEDAGLAGLCDGPTRISDGGISICTVIN